MTSGHAGKGSAGVSSSGLNRTAAYSGDETILLAEDNESLRDMVVSMLGRYGYSVMTAERLEDVDRIASTSIVIDLLLTDVSIPGATGRQFAEQVFEHWPDAPVIYMSGYSEAILLAEGHIDEGSYFIQKPFSATALAKKVREVLDDDESESVSA